MTVTRQAFREAARLAGDASSGLRSGDSLHLAMALEAGATKIVTADGILQRHAETFGIGVIRA
jgi:predicted nucleic acid-binding protein